MNLREFCIVIIFSMVAGYAFGSLYIYSVMSKDIIMAEILHQSCEAQLDSVYKRIGER